MSEARATIAVVIPAYKAERHIASVIAGIPLFVETIVVVDDGSVDATAERAVSTGDGRVLLVRHERNQGLGAAMRTGYRKALELGAEIVVKMDADDQMDPAALPDLVEPLLARKADYAKGNRFYDLEALRAMPAVRRFGNTALSFLAKAASGYWNVSDPTNGYTAIRREALERVDFSRVHRRYFFENSMLIHLNILGAVVTDVPIPARYGDEASSLRVGRVLLQFPWNLALGLVGRVYWRYMMLDLAPQALFLVFGLAGLLFGGVFGLWRWYVSISTGVVQSTGTVMVATLPFLMGFLLLLQAVVLDIGAIPRKPLCARTERKRADTRQPGNP